MMLNANLKINCSHVNYRNIILLFLGSHISHNFAIHVDKHHCHKKRPGVAALYCS